MRRLLLSLVFLLPFYLFSQETVSAISGRVVNENNAGLPFASITIKGTSIGTVSDSAGYFTLTSTQKIPYVVLVTFSGYASLQFTVRNGDVKNAVLQLQSQFQNDTVVITSRRRREVLQDVPIPVSVIGGRQIDNQGTFNVNRLKELVPSLQLYSSNPRNTGINIRGLGSPFGLTNDGLDPGVGYYVDGVYQARPAAATLDFIDIEQVEVLRGPQGTLFGKNTTAGAINITTRKPSFKSGANFELSYGNYGYIQAKTSLTGALSKKIAARVSFSGTQRNGLVENIRTGKYTNDINNLGVHAQILYKPSDKTTITLSGDDTRQRPDGYAQVVAGVVETKRPAYRQFNAIISDLNYSLPTLNAFDRKIDHDVPWNSGNDLGGVSLNLDQKIGPGTLTSTTAWRYWHWNPSNDRDFTGLQALAKSQNPAKHKQFSQEIRYAGQISSKVSGVVGVFFLSQEVKITGTEESGKDQWRFVQSTPSDKWATPGLFDGYGISTDASIKSQSAAVFANVDWEAFNRFHIMPGIRYNYDKKDVVYDRVAAGGLETEDPALIALKKLVYTSQAYDTAANETNLTYQLTLSYKIHDRVNAYATYSTSYKPVGVNVAGLPTIDGKPATDLAVIKPEYVNHVEIGVKTTPVDNFLVNATFFNTDIENYQANVQSPQLGVNRGYIANAEKVNVKGFEVDVNLIASQHFTFYGSTAYTDAKYVKFTNAPLPLEETGTTKDGQQVAFKDISGGRLPGISKWAVSVGGEYSTPAAFFGKAGKFFVAIDGYYRSGFSSSPSPSAYLNIDAYSIANGRLGFRAVNGLSAFIWGRNLFNKNYYEQLLVAGGNAGQYAAVLGDQRTYGATIRYSF
ncbi:TonB-dependent receptor [Flavihumibacter fluvii]|uniref:TonB-dependent receptor n=1 Tax=Flavihumibacter fluvii TaxID=2838157 RepID=UPI001BDE583F|nr:TonB-dependent receptor [Flavihumibacter fluvii]ULQ51784.1 TonB-dependent receptor [Flavihumibacter fluvii]